MVIKPLRIWAREQINSLFEALEKGPEFPVLILITSYIVSFLMLKINWIDDINETMMNFRLVFFSIVLWGSSLYLFYIIAEWKKLWKHLYILLPLAGILCLITIYFGKQATRDSYTVIMGIVVCILVAHKNYRNIVKCVMYASIIALFVACISVFIGYTQERLKPDNINPGRSFGIIYPNTWGYIAFLGIMAYWYLYMQGKPFLTFIVYWIISAFMYYVISCRTIAIMTALFPFIALLANENKQKYSKVPNKRIGLAITILPFVFFAITAILCWQYEWVHKYFYNTPLHTMAMRFVQGGMAFREFGVTLFGRPMESNHEMIYYINGVKEVLYVMDNSFASYVILRGAIWMTLCLSWLSYANWKGWKYQDYGILIVSFMLLVFSLMERPGLDTWYNFVLLYPLAKETDKIGNQTEMIAETNAEEETTPN